MRTILNLAESWKNLILTSAMLLVLLAAAFVLYCRTSKKKVKAASAACIALILLLYVGAGFIYVLAATHGATDEDLQSESVCVLLHNSMRTHRMSELPGAGELSDCYIMYYKFTCPDCLGTYAAMMDYLRTHRPEAKIYYIASNSTVGKALMDKYSVAQVPSMVYIYSDGEKFLSRQLYYYEAGSDEPVFDGDAVGYLFQARRDLLENRQAMQGAG